MRKVRVLKIDKNRKRGICRSDQPNFISHNNKICHRSFVAAIDKLIFKEREQLTQLCFIRNMFCVKFKSAVLVFRILTWNKIKKMIRSDFAIHSFDLKTRGSDDPWYRTSLLCVVLGSETIYLLCSFRCRL